MVDGGWKKGVRAACDLQVIRRTYSGSKDPHYRKIFFVTPSLVLCPELIEGINMKSFYSLPIDRHFFHHPLMPVEFHRHLR
jgi:hypothetical protein